MQAFKMRYFHIITTFYFGLSLLMVQNTFAQSASDSLQNDTTNANIVAPPPTNNPTLSPPNTIKQPDSANVLSAKTSEHSLVKLEFVKHKALHSPDSMYFNILKITNTNSTSVAGKVRISVPKEWALISGGETEINVAPGATKYIPFRVSMDRRIVGGTSYIISATLVSDRSLYSDKNQYSVSKSCYITSPQRRKWDLYPVQRSIYFDRYNSYTPMLLRLSNKGNGVEVVKLDFEIGSSLQMFGALGNRHFTSVELRPNRDTVISFLVRYTPPDESDIWNRDFKRFSIRINAVSDSIVQKTSVTYKYLESKFYNLRGGRITPLTIELGLQNILSESSPSLLFAGYGTVLFKNDDNLDYNVRFFNIPFYGFGSIGARDFLWQRSRIYAGYKSKRWEIGAGDINAYGSPLLAVLGRGIGGQYDINSNNTVGAALTGALGFPMYSGTIFHDIKLPKSISLRTTLNGLQDDFNKINTYGGSFQIDCPITKGHFITFILASVFSQHNYDSLSFIGQNGIPNPVNDPGISRLGFASQLNYRFNMKKLTGSLFAFYSTRNYFHNFSGRVSVNANAQYVFNSKYSIVATSVLFFQDPIWYNRGVLVPENKFMSGVHRADLSNRISSKLTFYAGPLLEHISFSALKIDNKTGDSTNTYFTSISPKIALRASYKTSASGFITPYTIFGYTYVTSALDSTITVLSPLAKSPAFFNARAGLNVIQGNWGINIFYFYGPYSFINQQDFYYFGRYNKSIRIMPFIQKYYFNKTLLFSSYNSYFYEVVTNNERISLNARLHFFLGKDWDFFVDNNLFLSSIVSSEGRKSYSRSMFLNLGVKKVFDIPQPKVKYYDLKIVCFKDVNGNQVMDGNEQALSDIVISVDRSLKFDSTKNTTVSAPGIFSPTEMVTDNFGYCQYFHLPEGEIDLGVYPLQNLKDVYILNGQKQKFFVSRDTTYYIPFVQSFRMEGKIIVNRDEFSAAGQISLANIRITATDSTGNSFPALSTADGSYVLYVPKAGEYKAAINNVFGDKFILQDPEYTLSFDGAKLFIVDFIFNEKKREMNITSSTYSTSATFGDLTNPNGQSLQVNNTPAGNVTTSATNVAKPDSTSTANPPASNSGVIYRIQIGSSANKIPASQFTVKFKGAENVKEYMDNGVYKYTAGEFTTWEFDKATEYKDKLIAAGYTGAFVVFIRNGKRVK